ncbi:hypothetical protein Hanom_Chr09g00774831 [Helianthus anomalus]
MMLRLEPRLYVDDGIFDAKVAALVDELDVKSPKDHSVKIAGDVNDPQLHSNFFVDEIPASPSVVSNTIVEDKQAVDRPCKVQNVHLTSSTSEPVLHFTIQAEHNLVSF